MSYNLTTPSLSAVLVVLNIILALVWERISLYIDEPTNVFRAVLFINAAVAARWIWTNTSLRRRASALCRFTVATLRILGPLFLELLQASLWLVSVLELVFVGRRAYLAVKDETQRIYGHASALARLAFFPSKSMSHGSTVRAPHSPTRCGTIGSLAVRDGIATEAHTTISAHTPTGETPRDVLPSTHSTSAVLHDCHPPESTSQPPTHLSAHSLRSGHSITNPDPPSSSSSLSDTAAPEAMRTYRTVRALTRERDFYRTRAYHLAMRLDERYTAHAQIECALERMQKVAVESQSALAQLEAERRDLSVALAVAVTAARRATATAVQPEEESEFAEGDTLASRVRIPTGDVVLYPKTPRKRTCAGADERPLLLPPTAETTEDTPTRPRLSTWTSGIKSVSRLHGILLHTRRRAEMLALAQKQGAGAAFAQPVFSVDSEGAADELVLTAAQVEADTIIEDLRMSRHRTSPCTSPVLDQNAKTNPVRQATEVEGAQTPGSDTLAVPTQVLRQPRGPPPSPFATAAEKALAQVTQKVAGHTWRGRGRTDADAHARPGGVLGPEPYLLYSTSRMPNRPHARQTTAPPTSTATARSSASTTGITPTIIGTIPVAAPKAATKAAPMSTTAIGEERRRHSTFNSAGAGVASVRWQMSALGKGAIDVDKLRTAVSQHLLPRLGAKLQQTGA